MISCRRLASGADSVDWCVRGQSILTPSDELAGQENPSMATVRILPRSPRDVVVLRGPLVDVERWWR
jgi:hypothetical protein